MERSQFLRLADGAILRIEDWLEAFDPDEVDFSSADGVIKIQFADGPTFVMNRQTATNQMWYAAGVRAWHYDFDPPSETWLCDKDGHELFARIGETVSQQLGRTVRGGLSEATQIQLHRLEGFYWVARTGGYARAARAFPYPITQPAVHSQVKKLEEELGTSLFERVAKDRMAPTPAGLRLYDFVRPFFESLPTVVRSIQGGDFGGELRVTSSSLLIRRLMPAWVRRLHDAQPDVHVHLEETGDDAIALLRRGEVDLAVEHLYEVPDDIATMPVAELLPLVVLPLDHGLAGTRPLQLESLGDTPFVAYAPGQKARELQFEALARVGITPPSMLSGASAETILGFVEAGLGWSILPWLKGSSPDAAGIAAAPLEGLAAKFDVVAAWRKDTPENPLLDAMLEAAPPV